MCSSAPVPAVRAARAPLGHPPVRGLGTVLNVVTVALGTTIGVRFGARVAERFRAVVMEGIGLVVLTLGVLEARDTHNAVILLASLLAGGLIGEALRLEERIDTIGGAIQRRVARRRAPATIDPPATDGRARFVEGFRVASIVFCVGPLTILGSIQDGLRGHIDLLATKSMLDGFASLAFAATYGWGVGAAIVTIVVVQGSITAAAAGLHHVLSARMVDEMSAAGGVMLVGLGLRLLDIKAIRVASFLPALVVAPLLVAVFVH